MVQNSSLSVVVLSAGKGTRMKSNKAKVLHELFYAPMIHHVLKVVEPLKPLQTIVIVGHQRRAVEESLNGFDVEFAVQEQQLGTGHAALCTEEQVGTDCDTVMILCGDTPLIHSESLAKMAEHHQKCDTTLTVMTTIIDDPTNYGRIVCDDSGKVRAIVEEKDATQAQRAIKEINTGIYCVEKEFLFDALKRIGTDNSQGEVYLTDIVSLAVTDGHRVETFINSCPQDVLGVNSRVEMAQAHTELQRRRNKYLMLQGVSMINPDTINIDNLASVGPDTIINPGVHISGKTVIGSNCLLENGVILKDCTIGDQVQIGAYSYLDGTTIGDKTILKPYTFNVIK